MGQCNGTGGGAGSAERLAKTKKLIDGAATDNSQFTHNVGQLKGVLAADERPEDPKNVVQIITEGMLDGSKPDEQRFWYLLILRHLLDIQNKKLADLTAKKLGNTFKAIAMHRSEERIMSRGRDCLKNISSNVGRSVLMQILNGLNGSSIYSWS